MTNKEAIEYIENEIKIDVALCNNNDIENHIECFKIACEALEKQLPKKPVYNCIRRALCPVCDGELYPSFLYVRRFKHHEMRIEEKMPYCKHCGQALDWGK